MTVDVEGRATEFTVGTQGMQTIPGVRDLQTKLERCRWGAMGSRRREIERQREWGWRTSEKTRVTAQHNHKWPIDSGEGGGRVKEEYRQTDGQRTNKYSNSHRCGGRATTTTTNNNNSTAADKAQQKQTTITVIQYRSVYRRKTNNAGTTVTGDVE